MNDVDTEKLLVAARRHWLNHFGRARCRNDRRIDKGVKRRIDSSGERGFLQQHQRGLHALADIEVAVNGGLFGCHDWASNLVESTDFTAQQQGEVAFNRAKIQTAKVEALLAQHLTPEEVTPDIIAVAEDVVRRLAEAQHRRALGSARVKRLIQKPAEALPALAATAGPAALLWHESGQLRGRLSRATKARRRSDASIFAVADPANASIEVTFICGLVGGALVAASGGGIVAFNRALRTPRFVYVTLGFMQEPQLKH